MSDVSYKNIIIVKRSNIPNIKFTLKGYFFKYKEGNGLYLSGGSAGFNTALINFYTNVRLVSSANPPISGRPIENFKIMDNETIQFTLPPYLSAGHYNIIFCNPAGYTRSIYGDATKIKSLSVIE